MSALLDSARDWINAGLGFVYPEVCHICGQARATPAENYLCAECRGQLRFIEPPFCSHCGCPYPGAITTEFECANCREMKWQFRFARSAAVARDTLLEVIHRYKYNRALWFEPFLAGLLIDRAAPELSPQSWDWLVPVPLHPAKQREREFNQAQRLAARLSRATGIPTHTRLLRRLVPTRTQTLLSREERLANVRNAFGVRGTHNLAGQRLVLIDDVMTTGATTDACAAALRRAGAADVCVWTVARGI